MNPELQNALVDFVNKATVLLESGTAQLPAVLNDIVAYKLFSAWFDIGLGIFFLTVAVIAWLLYAASQQRDERVDYYRDDWREFFGPIVGTIGSLFGLLFLIGGAWHVYYVTHFPRLVILDYLKGML